MKVALVIPPVVDFYFTPQRASFLGVQAVKRILVEDGCEVRIFNGIRPRGRAVPLPEELAYLSPYLGGELFFKSYRRFGVSEDTLVGEIIHFAPDRILIACFAFCYAAETIHLANAIKRAAPGITVIAGGAGVTAYPEYFLSNSSIDYAVSGEAEKVLLKLMHTCPVSPGVITAGIDDDGAFSYAPDLVKCRETRNEIYYSTMITRGCTRKCSFCSVRQVFPVYRRQPPDEIDALFSQLPATSKKIHVNFEDDNVSLDFDYFTMILESLGKHSRGNFSFSLENGIDFMSLDGEKIRFLKQNNIKQFNFSMVSLNPNVLRDNGRDYTALHFTEIVETSREHGIPVISYLITGLPGENYESIMEGISFLEKLPLIIGVSTYYPIPGISGFEDLTKFDGISPRLCTGTSFYPWGRCTSDELVRIFMRARKISLSKFDQIIVKH